MIAPLDHAAEFRRCLETLDVKGVRRLWQFVSPHLPQPKNDSEALHTIHLARASMATLPLKLKSYSEQWLKERETGVIAHSVGIAVGMHGKKEPRLVDRLLNTRGAMEHAVITAVQDGVDLATESVEIKKRIMTARQEA